jgi:hypothetical protein
MWGKKTKKKKKDFFHHPISSECRTPFLFCSEKWQVMKPTSKFQAYLTAGSKVICM